MISLHEKYGFISIMPTGLAGIQELVVLPQMRGQEVGSQLLARAEEARRGGRRANWSFPQILNAAMHTVLSSRRLQTGSHFRFCSIVIWRPSSGDKA